MAEPQFDLHALLMKFANEAYRSGKTTGLKRLVDEIPDQESSACVKAWLARYTPIERRADGGRMGAYLTSPLKRAAYSAVVAEKNPYWTITLAPKEPVMTLGRGKRANSPTTEQGVAKAYLRAALTRFIALPTPSSRASLDALLADYAVRFEKPGIHSMCASVVSGGIPGLGRRR